MPLSENEQRQLEAIERALMADDKKFADRVRSTDLRTHSKRRIARAIVLFVVGMVLLATSPFLPATFAFGFAGFLLMFVAVLSGASALKRLRGHTDLPRFATGGGGPRRAARPESQGWRDRVEDRWKRRWEERD